MSAHQLTGRLRNALLGGQPELAEGGLRWAGP